MQRDGKGLRSRQSQTALQPTMTSLAGSTLFCDFDGPIADVSERYYSTYRLALADIQAAYAVKGVQLPIRTLSKAQFWYMKQNCVPDTQIADWSGLADDEVEEFLGRVQQIVNHTTLLHQDRLQAGVPEAIAQLRRHRVRLVIVTLRHAAQVLQFLHDHGLAAAVSQIYGATDDSIAYPNRIEHKKAQLQDAIADQQRQGISPQSTWMVGDTEADIRAGQALGISTIGLTCGIRSAVHLAHHRPTHLCSNLESAVQFLLSPNPQPVAC